jgi:putative aldouronate transport system substrate-binding protein
MNKTIRLIVVITTILVLGTLVVIALRSCQGGGSGPVIDEDNMAVLDYPDFPDTPDDNNSWEYLDGSDEMTITWYVDVASWNPPTGLDQVSQIIKEKTGITVIFDTPVTDDGQKLATMIAGGDMPDVISIPTDRTQTITGLAQQGYVYDINTLADKWAPTLYDHLPEDVLDWWAYGNGKTYGIPNHYYSYEEVPDGQLQPNGGMMVRKDIFDAWQTYVESNLKGPDGMVSYTSRHGQEMSVPWEGYITTPEGFKEAAVWALENYASSLTTGLQLAQFRSDGSASLNWLSQFFAIPFEDENGDYVYQFTQESYEDMLYYLNDLYLAGVISPSNFTQDYDGVGAVIAGGDAFATLVTPQNYQIHFTTAKDAGYTYETMYITNSDGDTPVLSDIRGYGYMFSMITLDAERPDVIIKLFDFLTSKEGQRLVSMGPEGVTWNWTDGEESTIAYTDTYLSEKATGQTAQYGLLQFDLLLNWQYYDNVQPQTNHGKTEAELFRTNLKRPLTVYAYDYNAMAFVVDATDDRFQTYSNNLTRIQTTIGTQLPKIIRASSRSAAEDLYDSTVSAINARGLDLVIQMNSEAFRRAKEKLGITIAWPPFKPDYVDPLDRTEPNGDLSLYRGY